MQEKPATVRLVFRGEVLDGFVREAVMRNVGAALRVEGERLARLFSGAPVVLRRGLDSVDAERHAMRLASLGAHVHIEPEEPPARAAAKPPAPPAAAVAASAPTSAAASAPSATQDQVTCPNCGEVQPMRNLCRACATDLPMALAARREADEQARAQRRTEFRARHGLAPAESAPTADSEPARILGLGWRGRLGRWAYAGASLWMLAALTGLAFWAVSPPGTAKLALFTLAVLAVLWFSLRLAVLRLHDIGRSGWWSLLLPVPVLGSVVGLLLFFWPGTSGDNAHGDPPEPAAPLLAGSGVLALVLVAWLGGRSLLALATGGLQGPASVPSPATASTGAERLPNAEARAGFERDYLPARQHKAFAVSAGGSWGWVGGANAPEVAMWDATVNCEAHRKREAPRCEVVNVNGQWLDAAPR